MYDGSGRTGRIINILYLIMKGYLHQLTEAGILELYKIGKENIFINKELGELLKE